MRLPRKISKSRFIYGITESIVVKNPINTGSAELERENAIYDTLEQHAPCPYVMQSFYRTPGASFLPFMSGGSLDTRLARNQVREKGQVVRVLGVEDRRLVERWAAELCAAVAWLEALGLVHADLRPPNVLLDGRDHLKLADFDCAARVGERSRGNAPPWARLYPDPLATSR